MTAAGNSVPLFFITGFLGSGKTTLLNRLLDEAAARGKKIGVIINEWGRVNIDSSLLQTRDIEIKELNNGQVFCSCLSGNFVEALALYAAMPLDLVIVETSGMANPVPLRELLCDLERLTGAHYSYQGMTALVDPESFLDLAEVVNAVEEQIIASQRIIINKVDLADAETLGLVRGKIRQLNPTAEILETSYAQVEGFLDANPLPLKGENPFVLRKVKTPYKRPTHYIVTTEESVSPEKAAAFVREILPDSLRVKGFVHDADRGWFYVDGVNDKVETKAMEVSGTVSKLVIIPKTGDALLPGLKSAWKGTCGVPFSLS